MLRLVPPSLDGMPGYAAALSAGWSPSTIRDVSGEQLALLRRDPVLLIEELTRQDGVIKTESGEHPRLPSRVFWLDDSEFCGAINLRFQIGTDALPPRQSQQPRGLALVAVGALESLANQRLLVLIERHAFRQELVRRASGRYCGGARSL